MNRTNPSKSLLITGTPGKVSRRLARFAGAAVVAAGLMLPALSAAAAPSAANDYSSYHAPQVAANGLVKATYNHRNNHRNNYRNNRHNNRYNSRRSSSYRYRNGYRSNGYRGNRGYSSRRHNRSSNRGYRQSYNRGYSGGYNRGYNNSCRRVSNRSFWNGRRAVVGGLQCVNSRGYSYIVPNSRYFIRFR